MSHFVMSVNRGRPVHDLSTKTCHEVKEISSLIAQLVVKNIQQRQVVATRQKSVRMLVRVDISKDVGQGRHFEGCWSG